MSFKAGPLVSTFLQRSPCLRVKRIWAGQGKGIRLRLANRGAVYTIYLQCPGGLEAWGPAWVLITCSAPLWSTPMTSTDWPLEQPTHNRTCANGLPPFSLYHQFPLPTPGPATSILFSHTSTSKSPALLHSQQFPSLLCIPSYSRSPSRVPFTPSPLTSLTHQCSGLEQLTTSAPALIILEQRWVLTANDTSYIFPPPNADIWWWRNEHLNTLAVGRPWTGSSLADRQPPSITNSITQANWPSSLPTHLGRPPLCIKIAPFSLAGCTAYVDYSFEWGSKGNIQSCELSRLTAHFHPPR